LITTIPGVADLGIQRPATEELRAQYRAYRVRQAWGLIRMLPREVIRPLYRRALLKEGVPAPRSTDSLAVLLEYCEGLLPLPPFEVWMEDVTLHPVAHLHDLDDSAEVPTATAPVTMEARLFDYVGEPWIAHLRSFRDGGTWRGYIAFQEQSSGTSGRVHRTALVFRESDPADLRERFLSFEPAALGAFLRSALP